MNSRGHMGNFKCKDCEATWKEITKKINELKQKIEEKK
jgi:tRNA(Ile2) C34 agmatinyltransferase TiaS